MGKKLNVTKAWKAQNPVLREVVDMLTEQLLGIQLENYIPRGKFQMPRTGGSRYSGRLETFIVFM